MRRGTATRSGEAIDREIEFLGTQVSASTWEDGFGFGFNTLTRFFEPAVAVAADVMLNPTFPDEGIAREKALQVAALKRSLDSSTERPLQLFRAAMFPGHPYGLPEHGTEATIASIDRAALQAWWKSSIAADRALVVVVGNAEAEDVRRAIEARLASMPRTAGPLAALPPPRPPEAVKEALEARDRKQTAMVIGFPAVAPSNPDWHVLRLAQFMTSGSLSGTFYRELRGRQSLAYVVFARPQSFAQQGAFVGYLAGDAAKEATARNALLAELRKLQGEGVREEDLARAKPLFAGVARISREPSSALVTEYGRNYVLSVPLDHVDLTLRTVPGISAQDMRAVARRYFSADNYVYAAVRGSTAQK
jgi:zinc protease